MAPWVRDYIAVGNEIAPVPALRLSLAPSPDGRHLPRVTCVMLHEGCLLLSERWRNEVGALCALVARIIEFLDYLEGRESETPTSCAAYDILG